MQFTVPTELPGLLPFGAACVTVFLGLIALFAPGLLLRALKLQPHDTRPSAIGEPRSMMAGFWLGVGIVALFFFDQMFIQLCLGAGWLMSGFGRFVSILSDDGASLLNWVILLVMLALAGAALAPALGFIS
ncbi:DUF4345 domain-containing protein [Fulvimarina sp. 2208YS6-2-32]|uniref:DUF4345 domain-containing protein n=1 Tax=Fulvimarina uroteuthidis TaxID=3098149 RepID=A0ABU5I4G4_9HYPH|nr:DUF4345 domain-containing protein [Fulvimarina sp. 2208YS6-2-32]MDY8110096.1 DUF4345 domain-containing protein [Fulvimarina sp. 2208YS6-2-32]